MKADLTHVTSRNSQTQNSPLAGKRIALVGCGTIGSYLARFLVQSGAGNGQPLTLVDKEDLVSGNIGRHLLNFDDIGQGKAKALAQELRRFHPDIQISHVEADVLDCIQRLLSHDLIIDATGIENVSEFLSRKALEQRQAGRTGNILHVRLYGNGITAQTLLNVGEGFACYSCLWPHVEGAVFGDPRKDVTKEHEVQHASCGDGPFVPFLVSAPVTAAALALDATVDFFSGKPGLRFRSRILNAEEAKHVKDKSPEPNSQCRVCGGKN